MSVLLIMVSTLSALPILPGAKVSTDGQGNISMTYTGAIPVKRGRPVMMGFVAEVSYFGPAYCEIDPRNECHRTSSARL